MKVNKLTDAGNKDVIHVHYLIRKNQYVWVRKLANLQLKNQSEILRNLIDDAIKSYKLK